MSEYKCTIVESSRTLTAKERIQAKNVNEVIKLGEECKENRVLIDVDYWVHLHIHNDKSDDKEYEGYLLVDKNGSKYYTGSESFWRAFESIWEEVDGNDIGEWSLAVTLLPSKNRSGQSFLTCDIV